MIKPAMTPQSSILFAESPSRTLGGINSLTSSRVLFDDDFEPNTSKKLKTSGNHIIGKLMDVHKSDDYEQEQIRRPMAKLPTQNGKDITKLMGNEEGSILGSIGDFNQNSNNSSMFSAMFNSNSRSMGFPGSRVIKLNFESSENSNPQNNLLMREDADTKSNSVNFLEFRKDNK